MSELMVLSEQELDVVTGGFYISLSHNQFNIAVIDSTAANVVGYAKESKLVAVSDVSVYQKNVA